MLWSLIKILLFVVLVAALTLGVGQLMESETGLRLAVAGWEFTLGPLQAVIVALLLLVLVWLTLKLAGFLVAVLKFATGDETAISRFFNRNRERRGFKAMAESMMALASGDGREALVKAARAERLLARPELTNLLTAQAAELSGDRRKATDTYKQLLKDDRTRFVGVRGLMKQKLSEGDTDTALKLAEKAFALKPAHEETQDTLLRLQAGSSDWKGARKTLNAKLRYGALPRDVHKRRDAVLALSEAKDVLAEDSSIETREAAIEANRLSPDLIPAAAMAARSYIEQGKPRFATRVLKKAWGAQPHPDLAAAFAEIAPQETPQDRIKRFKALTDINPQDTETRLLLTELHIAAEDFPAARDALGDLPQTDPTARSLALLAAIEKGQGADDSVVRGWLAAAVTASRGPQWVCDNCGAVHGQWGPVCHQCSSFDTLSWRTPLEHEHIATQTAQMLPLIVGEPAVPEVTDQSADALAPEETAEPMHDPVVDVDDKDPMSSAYDSEQKPSV